MKTRWRTLWSTILAVAATTALAEEPFTVLFDFTPDTGDRDRYFAERQPADTFDVNGSAATGLSVVNADYLNAQNFISVWLVLNDTNPDTLDAGPSATVNDLKAGTNVLVRTRLQYLYASANSVTNEAASAGILFGLTGTGGTRSGYLARVDRANTAVGGTNNYAVLHIDEFTNGVRGASLVDAGFVYGANKSVHFLELRITSDGVTTNATLRIFADAIIPGSGFDTNRLIDTTFDTATPEASFTLSLGNYHDGFLALYAEDNSNKTDNNPTAGIIRFANFYASFDVAPPAKSRFGLAATAPLATEGGTAGAITLTRSGKTDESVMVDYTVSGTASNGVDYTLLSGTVNLTAGQIDSVIYVNALTDAVAEPVETVTLTLNTNGNYEIIGLGTATVLIADATNSVFSILGFDDEFNAVALDTSVWARDSYRTNVSVTNGVLQLTTRPEASSWREGSIQTVNYAGKYGYYEARLKVNDASGLNNAFWLNTPRDVVAGNSVDRTEIDITEAHYNDNSSHMTFHDWAPTHWASGSSATIPNISAAYHTVALEWQNDNTLVYYWDGVAKRTLNAATLLSADTMIPLSVLFSTKVIDFAGTPGPGLDGSQMLVDYVRVWQKAGWTGAVNGNWGSATNWGPDGIPGSGEAAIFNGLSSNTTVSIASDKSCHSLYFDNAACPGFTLAAGAFNLHLGAASDGIGGITLNTPVANSQSINLNLVADRGVQFGNFSRTPDTTLILNGNIDGATSNEELQFCGFGPVQVAGALSANIGQIIKWGANTVRFTGANAHTGAIEVRDGVLVAGSPSALGSTASATAVSSGASLVFAGGLVYTNPEPVNLSGFGDSDWQGALDVEGAGKALFNGPLTLDANVTLAGGTNGCELELAGPISGAFSITKAGAGALTLSGNNTYSGATTVSAGKLIVNGTSASAVTVSGGTLGGVGVVSNNVTVNQGTHALRASPGLMQIKGDYTLASSAVLQIEIKGTAPGTQYGQVWLSGGSGTVTLAGALQVVATNTLPLGSSFIIITNSGGAGVIGAFAGLPQGHAFYSSGCWWRISYSGGNGNEVVLTMIPPPAPTLAAVLTNPNGWNLIVTGEVGHSVDLYTSTNLSSWFWVTSLLNATGTLFFSEPIDTNQPTRFYRAALLP